jgi:hypothetical protein
MHHVLDTKSRISIIERASTITEEDAYTFNNSPFAFCLEVIIFPRYIDGEAHTGLTRGTIIFASEITLIPPWTISQSIETSQRTHSRAK